MPKAAMARFPAILSAFCVVLLRVQVLDRIKMLRAQARGEPTQPLLVAKGRSLCPVLRRISVEDTF